MRRAASSVLGLLLALGCADPGEPGDPAGDQAGEADPGDGATDPEDGEDDESGAPDEDLGADRDPAALVAGCTATGTLGGHPVWLHFTNPLAPCRPTATAEPGVDAHILTELVRLIDSVPPGGSIDGHIFNITVDAVAAALVRAEEERGVTVTISTDGQVGASADTARTEHLDRLDRIVYCGDATRTSCVASADGAISHTKLFVFSSATAPDGVVHDEVVWFGSANQTRASGMKTFNNTVTVYGDPGFYGLLLAYLDDLFGQRRRADYYDAASGRGYLLADAADAYASPEADTDLIVNRLNDVEPAPGCEVRVMQASVRDSRLDVVRLLARMKQGGCAVRVVASTIEPAAEAALRAAGIPMRRNRVHDKLFLVDGRYGGERRLRVYGGSHNLSGSANRRFDEIFVKLAPEPEADHPVYDAYLVHFDDAYAGGEPL